MNPVPDSNHSFLRQMEQKKKKNRLICHPEPDDIEIQNQTRSSFPMVSYRTFHLSENQSQLPPATERRLTAEYATPAGAPPGHCHHQRDESRPGTTDAAFPGRWSQRYSGDMFALGCALSLQPYMRSRTMRHRGRVNREIRVETAMMEPRSRSSMRL